MLAAFPRYGNETWKRTAECCWTALIVGSCPPGRTQSRRNDELFLSAQTTSREIDRLVSEVNWGASHKAAALLHRRRLLRLCSQVQEYMFRFLCAWFSAIDFTARVLQLQWFQQLAAKIALIASGIGVAADGTLSFNKTICKERVMLLAL